MPDFPVGKSRDQDEGNASDMLVNLHLSAPPISVECVAVGRTRIVGCRGFEWADHEARANDCRETRSTHDTTSSSMLRFNLDFVDWVGNPIATWRAFIEVDTGRGSATVWRDLNKIFGRDRHAVAPFKAKIAKTVVDVQRRKVGIQGVVFIFQVFFAGLLPRLASDELWHPVVSRTRTTSQEALPWHAVAKCGRDPGLCSQQRVVAERAAREHTREEDRESSIACLSSCKKVVDLWKSSAKCTIASRHAPMLSIGVVRVNNEPQALTLLRNPIKRFSFGIEKAHLAA